MTRIVCFGEMLLRLAAPGRELLLRSPVLEAGFGGAEANVAWALAGLGADARMATVLPEGPIGDACLGELRRYGVDVTNIVRRPGRMGVYFLTRGAMQRPAEVVYDRAESAFALAEPAALDWSLVLAGADWLHVSGITPALGDRCATSLATAVDAAARLGVPVSFDCNFRPSLWRGREDRATDILRGVAQRARLLIASIHDLALLFACSAHDDFADASRSAFAACASLQFVAGTERLAHGADRHDLTGHLADRQGRSSSRTYVLEHIVERIGAGDAYAAGVIHGLSSAFTRERTVEFAAALAAMKHSIPGDFVSVTPDRIESFLKPAPGDVRR